MAFVNSASATSEGAGTTVASSAFAATAGNLIAVAVGTYFDTSTVASVTDTAGNTYTLVRRDTPAFAGSLEIWYAKNITGHASNVVTVTFNASVNNRRTVAVHQYSGRHLTAPVLTSATGSVTAGTSVTTGSFNPGEADADVFAALNTQGGESAHVAGTNYTKRVTVGATVVTEDRVAAPSGAQTAAMSWTTATDGVLSAVAFAKAPAEVKSISGSPALAFTVSPTPDVIGTQQISGSPGGLFVPAGHPALVVVKDIATATATLVFGPRADPAIPVQQPIWGIPTDFFGGRSGYKDIIFLGTREYGVFLEEGGQPMFIMPVAGEFRVGTGLRGLSGTPGVAFGLVGVPSIVAAQTVVNIAGSPSLRAIPFTSLGQPHVVAADSFGHPAQYITNVTGATEPDWNDAATNVVVSSALGDGVTDVTAQLQTAFDQAFAQGKKVILPHTAGGYKISSPLRLRTSISSVGGFGSRPRIFTTNLSTGFTAQGDILIIPNGASNIYIKNLHLQGNYVSGHPGTEDPACIALGGCSAITIRYCRLENPRGDCIGGRESLWTVASAPGASNVVVRNNEFINPFRCAVAYIWHARDWNIIDNIIDKDNAVEAGASFVSGIDIEPEVRNGIGGNCSNIEIAWNEFSMNNRTVNPNRGADGKAAFRWEVPGNSTPGGNHYLHDNFGIFGTGFWGSGGSNWGSVLLERNTEGAPPPPPVQSDPWVLVTSGSTFRNESNQIIRLRGFNWFGFEGPDNVMHGLWARNYKDMLQQVKNNGYNFLRVPFSNAMLEGGRFTANVNFSLNPDLQGLTPLQCLDKLIAEAATRGIYIMLDRHCTSPATIAALWYDGYTSEAKWISDWQFLADRYKNSPNVVAADLSNEPFQVQWTGNGNAQDWVAASVRCGNAIHAVNPRLVIVVEGSQTYGDFMNGGTFVFAGENLTRADTVPVTLSRANKVAYSPHTYPETVGNPNDGRFTAGNYPNNLGAVHDFYWNYLVTGNIAPVIVGEFGGFMNTTRDRQWFETLADRIRVSGASWAFWSLNPNSGDTGGWLNDDWSTVNSYKNSVLLSI